MDQNTIGRQIAELRKAHRLTQEALAEQLHVSASTVSKWESGKHSVDVETLGAIAQYFHVPVQSFFGETPEQTKPEVPAEQPLTIAKISRKGIILIATAVALIIVGLAITITTVRASRAIRYQEVSKGLATDLDYGDYLRITYTYTGSPRLDDLLIHSDSIQANLNSGVYDSYEVETVGVLYVESPDVTEEDGTLIFVFRR